MSKRFLSGINVTGTATLNTVANAGLDTDKFLVLDAAGNIDFRTGDELKLDIGANVVSRIEHEVKLGETMTIGTPVYIGVDLNAGTNMTVYKATNATEAGSSKTIGLIASSGITNDLVEVVTEGLLEGLNTSTATKGDPVWLGVNGALLFGLANKPVAPAHMVFLGIVTRVQQNNGEIFVKVQNGFEMSEIHNYLQGNVQNNEVIVYESATSLYKPKSIPTILGYTPVPDSRTLTINGTTYDLSANRSWTITTDASARSILRYVATANQTTFTISGGYTPGLTDVYRNGVKLDNSTDFTATNGTTIVLTNGASVNDVIEVYRYQTAFLANNALRVVTEFVATAGQTTFNVTYNSGLVDVFYNGSKLLSTEYTAGNGTSIILNFPCNVNDTLEVHAYSYAVGAFTGQAQLNGTGLVRMSGTTVTYDNATYATQSYVTTAVANLVNSAPATLDTLNELATALGNDANFATTITTSISTKQAQLNGTGFVKVSGTTVSYDNNTYLTSINSSQVTTALGYTPYNATNPSGYITSSALSSYLPLTGGTLTGALSGTSATFSSGVTFGANSRGFIREPAGDVEIGGAAGAALKLYTNGIEYAKLAPSTGFTTTLPFGGTSATFSSSVTAGDQIRITGTTAQALYLFGAAGVKPYITINEFGVRDWEIGAGTTTSGSLSITSTLGGTDGIIINGSGNVGIGTSTPATAGGGYTGLDIRGSGGASIILGNTSSINTYLYAEFSGLYVQTTSTTPILFLPGGSERMRITSGGNVGIGTTDTQGFRLAVDGPNVSQGDTTTTIRVFDTNSATTNSGGGISFAGYFSGTSSFVNTFSYIKGGKENSTAGDYAAYLSFGTRANGASPTERMRITSGGQVQIKQSADGFTEGLRWINTLGNRWTFVTGGDNNFYIGFNEASRGIFNSSTGVYTAQSDKNKKKDFEQSTIGLNAVLGLKPTLYRMKDDDELVEKHLGFIAQEVKEFIPQAYSESTNGDNTFIGLTEMPIIAALTKAIQEQQAQIEELKALIAAK